MENETLTCPYCGAPYRDTIPSGTVQVKCKYCGGKILVPTFFGGVIQRCLNHSDVLAVGLCNDCGRSYCESCLSLERVENGTLFLCPACRTRREGERTMHLLLFGLFVFLIGIFFVFLVPTLQNIIFGLLLFAFFASPFFIWGIYRTFTQPDVRTLRDVREERKQQEELIKIATETASPPLVYDQLLSKYLRGYDPKVAYDMLERRIEIYRMAGISRGEAVKKIADEEGLKAS